MTTTLLCITPEGDTAEVLCTYEGIKAGLDGATMDFVHRREVGCYVDDEGILKGLELNVPASMLFGQALYGPVVICAGEPDEDGDTVPADPEIVMSFVTAARGWRAARRHARSMGQPIELRPDADALPPPQILSFDDFDEMMRHLSGEEAGQ